MLLPNAKRKEKSTLVTSLSKGAPDYIKQTKRTKGPPSDSIVANPALS